MKVPIQEKDAKVPTKIQDRDMKVLIQIQDKDMKVLIQVHQGTKVLDSEEVVWIMTTKTIPDSDPIACHVEENSCLDPGLIGLDH